MCKSLQQYREDSGASQESLAEAMDTTQATISRWESGRVPRDDIARLSVVTSVPAVDYLWDVLGTGTFTPEISP